MSPPADRPTALIVRTAGINCDAELCRAFDLAGACARLIHLDTLIREPARLDDADLIAFPGGFSYGDDIASGRIFAVRAREHLYPHLRAAADRGTPIIGVCNGFQVLVQLGLLPGADRSSPTPPAQTIALTENAGARFLDDWVGIDLDPASPCVWTRGLADLYTAEERAHALMYPFAHGEGRFVAATPALTAALTAGGQTPVRYRTDVNGSEDRIAGVCDPTGRIFGLMPHPERFLEWNRHPYWTRLPPSLMHKPTPGLALFRAAVEAVAPARA